MTSVMDIFHTWMNPASVNPDDARDTRELLNGVVFTMVAVLLSLVTGG